jgi:predicted molibdopterin-dependent oxidoreductase YjgC
MTRRTAVLEREAPEARLEINPEDAKKFGIRNNDLVELESRRGSVRIKAEVTARVPRRVLFTTFHFHEAQVNRLTNSAFDPVAEIPEYKVCSVKIRRCS